MTDLPQAFVRRLSCYLDGELDEKASNAVELLAEKDPEVAALLADFLDTDAAVKQAFAALLELPLPGGVAEILEPDQAPARQDRTPDPGDPEAGGAFDIPQGSPEREAYAAIPPAPAGRGFVGLLSTVAVAVLAAGIGWFLGGKLSPQPAPVVVAAPAIPQRDWLREVADHHRIFASLDRYPADLPADDIPALEAWLALRTRVAFSVPDLTANGLTFQGARLLVAAGRPVGQLAYTDAGGAIHALYFAADSTGATAEPVATAFPGVSTVSWRTATATYALTAATASAGTLADVARAAADRL